MTDEDDNSSLSKEAVSEIKKDTTAVFSFIPEKARNHIKNKPWFVWVGGGLLALVILLLVLMIGFRQKEVNVPTAQWQEYYSDTLGFSISHPANWTVTETDAASGPDILIAKQDDSAFVRIRGLLDVNLNNTEAIQTSLDQYQKTLALQPDVRITSVQSQDVGEHVKEFTMTGEFPVTGSTFNFEEKGALATTGRVLLMRVADLPDNFEVSLPTMRKIVDSFTVEQRSDNAMFIIPSVFANTPQQPLASIGNVTFKITDYQANTVEPTDSRAELYASNLQGNIVNAGIPLGVQGRMLDELIQLREKNNQLNQGRGGRHLITDQNGDTFWGYKKYTGNLPEAAFRIDANINVFHRDASGDKQDLLVSVRIYDTNTGQLVGTGQASRKNTERIQNKQIVGSEPNWWQKYISGYAREVTYEDILSTVISEASADAANQLSALSNQEVLSDADRFARSLEESGYIPIVSDEIKRQSEGRGEQTGHSNDRDPNCPYFYATGTIDGPRTCFQTQAELNAALGVDSVDNPLGEPSLNNLSPLDTAPSDIYVDQNLVDYINWLSTVDGDSAASRQNYIDGQREAYRIQPVVGYSSEEDYIQAFTRALDQAITTNDAYTNETNSKAYDGSNTGTYQGPSSVTTESR